MGSGGSFPLYFLFFFSFLCLSFVLFVKTSLFLCFSFVFPLSRLVKVGLPFPLFFPLSLPSTFSFVIDLFLCPCPFPFSLFLSLSFPLSFV
ncbi:hypothetical protein B0J11DRAFT_544372 [Dendryphion nanum]|uniref:Uncharacterized protein n=1 Tax=Dendryphion nanum TaxID=256645 RepID=A0A9P9D082_9PLEO|nr:hypothetical protein B0J11DRAFT_544372 [Dendryphion nanum]